MLRVNVANHVVRTVQGVTQSVLIGSVVEAFNKSWATQKCKDAFESCVQKTSFTASFLRMNQIDCSQLLLSSEQCVQMHDGPH